jgi:hypothetical protein
VRVLADSLYNRIIVAGGGGGNSDHTNNQRSGDGGGDVGASGSYGSGGTQTAGGSGQVAGGTLSGFGIGGAYTTSTVGGGGGGWYGGGNGNGAGGGSGYVLTSTSYKPSGYFSQNANYYLSNTVNAQTTQSGFVVSPNLNGDGYAKISFDQIASAPTLTLTGANPMTIRQSDAFVDPGATAHDAIDGDITGNISVATGGLNTNVVGTYSVTYNVVNSFGLSTSVIRQVVVEPTTISTDFTCTGAAQTFTAPITGTYTLETWGAQGGGATNNTYTSVGSGGGYASGKVNLTQGETLYIHVGCKGGDDNNITSAGTQIAGGWNGGGYTYTYNNSFAGGGGGASDIRIGTDSLYARAIVAGGGGGNGLYASGLRNLVGTGYGGGLTGGEGARQYTLTLYGGGTGGTQTAGGTKGPGSSYSQDGSFGVGGNSTGSTGGWNGSGGGGGWYGGGSGGALGDGGGGGSGYVLTSGSTKPSGYLLGIQYYMTDTVINGGSESMPSTSGGVETGHMGDGHVRITYVVPAVADFDFTGSVQTWVVPVTGSYKFEIWGAQGGNGQTGNYNGDYLGGKGGYSTGVVNLTSGQTLYIYVGGQGKNAGQIGDGLLNNSFNGGGLSDSAATSTWGRSGAGGGASDIRIGTDSLYARVIVAGGGGGAGVYNFGSGSPTYLAHGGAGGGLQGLNGSSNSNTVGGGGGQTAGGSSGTGYTAAADFGVGGSMVLTSTSYASGAAGGGGWYGGGVSSRGNMVHTSGGGGGSSWYWSSATAANAPSGWLLATTYYLTNASTVAGDASMPNPAGGAMTGRSGNGFVRITRL